MLKKFVVVYDTETDDWTVELNPNLGTEDKSYLTLYEIMMGGIDMLESDIWEEEEEDKD